MQLDGFLVAQNTEQQYNLQAAIWQDEQENLLDIQFTGDFPWEKIRQRPATLWRYREAIPIPLQAEIISFGEGFTPIVEEKFLGKSVQLKMEYLFPSGSYKDRGATVLMTQAKFLGIKNVIQDSSGNAGSSIAQYAAKASIKADIFVPADTSADKLTQMKAYGAILHLVEGSRENTAQEAYQAAKKGYYASHVWNPFFLQGTKTFAFEIWEQNNGKIPDTIILPAGNGTLLLGTYIGFEELLKKGFIEKIPKLIGIQALNNAPLYESFIHGKDIFLKINPQTTIAEGIAIAQPKRVTQMLQFVRQTNGMFLAVSETEIREATQECLHKGYFIEPTSGAVIAGLKQYIEKFAQETEKILSVLTGSGLKTGKKLKNLFSL